MTMSEQPPVEEPLPEEQPPHQPPDEQIEETVDSREVIEEKIFSIKQRMVDFTVRQWDILAKINSVKEDVKTLEDKMEALTLDQTQAIDAEDYELADALDLKMKQVKDLIESKEQQLKSLNSNNHGQETLKAEKLL
jgi:phage shock protein A